MSAAISVKYNRGSWLFSLSLLHARIKLRIKIPFSFFSFAMVASSSAIRNSVVFLCGADRDEIRYLSNLSITDLSRQRV